MFAEAAESDGSERRHDIHGRYLHSDARHGASKAADAESRAGGQQGDAGWDLQGVGVEVGGSGVGSVGSRCECGVDGGGFGCRLGMELGFGVGEGVLGV